MNQKFPSLRTAKTQLLFKFFVLAILSLFLILNTINCASQKDSTSVFKAELDKSHSFLILMTEKASAAYQDAVSKCRQMHPGAEV
ncbi:MAG: hypothetical protein R6V00_05175, partial [Candidatus Aminicenantes bacterium]